MASATWDKSFWSIDPLNNTVWRLRENESVIRIAAHNCPTRETALQLGNRFYPSNEYLLWADFKQEQWARNPSGTRFGGGNLRGVDWV